MAPLEDRLQLQAAIVQSFLFDAPSHDCPFWNGPTLRGSVNTLLLQAVIHVPSSLHTLLTACNTHTQLASVEQSIAICRMQDVMLEWFELWQ